MKCFLLFFLSTSVKYNLQSPLLVHLACFFLIGECTKTVLKMECWPYLPKVDRFQYYYIFATESTNTEIHTLFSTYEVVNLQCAEWCFIQTAISIITTAWVKI